MAVNYSALKAALASSAYVGMTDTQIATALDAPITLTGQSFPWSAAVTIAQESANFSWARIQQRARQTATLPPATATDFAVLMAMNAVATDHAKLIDPAGWAVIQSGMQALVAVGDMTSADISAINALTTVSTTQAAQLGVVAGVNNLTQEIPAARLWPGVSA